MKTKYYMIALAAMTMTLGSCSDSENTIGTEAPKSITVSTSIGKMTRITTDAKGTQTFSEGDEISVYAWTGSAENVPAAAGRVVNNAINKLTDKVWVATPQMLWKNNVDQHYFIGIYPTKNVDNLTADTYTFNAENQAASDLLVAVNAKGLSYTKDAKDPVQLEFTHVMAKMVVNLSYKNQWGGTPTVKNVVVSDAFLSLDIAEGENKTTTETLAGIPELTAGKSYTYQLTVGKDKVSVSGITVKDWTTGDITGGKTEECPTPYITFTAEAEQKFKMTAQNGYEISGLEYSVNNGKWENVVANEEVPFGGTNGYLRLRGININGTASEWSTYSTITFTDNNVNVACTGDIRTLLDWRNYNIVETNNAKFCYLFENCSVLTTAPELPATKLAEHCYHSMFSGCTSLTSAPKLSAIELATQCYHYMFYGCTSLTSAPELPATKLADSCYDGMFEGCASLTSSPKLPATELEDCCYSAMFSYCTNLESAPELPAIKLAKSCYYEMFFGCSSLTSAPKLSAIELARACYCKMFYGCENLLSVTMLAPSDQISKATNCCLNWLLDAGTSATSRTLKVMDADAYTALEGKGYLPDNWKKDATNTTVKKEDNTEIK